MTHTLRRDPSVPLPLTSPFTLPVAPASTLSGVAVDIDNTVADTISGLRPLLAARLNVPADTLIGTVSYARPLVPAGPHCDVQLGRAYQDIWFDPALDAMPPLPDAARLLWELTAAGAFAGYVTRRPAAQTRSTLAWLARHGFPLKPVVHAQACKSGGLQALNAGILIDDHLDEITSVTQAGHLGVLLSQPHNAGAVLPPLACRAQTLAEALSHAVGALGALRACRGTP